MLKGRVFDKLPNLLFYKSDLGPLFIKNDLDALFTKNNLGIQKIFLNKMPKRQVFGKVLNA